MTPYARASAERRHASPRRRVLMLGALPPPHNGMTVFTRMLLEEAHLAPDLELHHLDTADRRGFANLGRLDPTNVYLAFKHAAQLVQSIVTARPGVVYLPITQNRLAFLRDAMLIGLSRLLGRRVVVHLHGSEFHNPFYSSESRWMRWLIRRTCRALDGAIVLSRRLRSCFAGLMPDERVQVVANGIGDILHGGSGPTSAHADRVRVMFLSSLRPRKGIYTILEAARALCARRPNVDFRCYGQWRFESDRQQAVDLLGPLFDSNRVRFPGPVWGVAKEQAFASTDVFVFPPEEPEGMPLVLIEAMSAGLPIVCTNQGAVADMLTDGQDALFVPPGDPNALGAAIARLCDSPELARRLGQAARRRYLENYTPEHCLVQLSQVLRGVA